MKKKQDIEQYLLDVLFKMVSQNSVVLERALKGYGLSMEDKTDLILLSYSTNESLAQLVTRSAFSYQFLEKEEDMYRVYEEMRCNMLMQPILKDVYDLAEHYDEKGLWHKIVRGDATDEELDKVFKEQYIKNGRVRQAIKENLEMLTDYKTAYSVGEAVQALKDLLKDDQESAGGNAVAQAAQGGDAGDRMTSMSEERYAQLIQDMLAKGQSLQSRMSIMGKGNRDIKKIGHLPTQVSISLVQQVKRLAKKLELIKRANTQKGKLNSKRIGRYPSQYLFTKRQKPEKEVNVYLLIDVSGSMFSSRDGYPNGYISIIMGVAETLLKQNGPHFGVHVRAWDDAGTYAKMENMRDVNILMSQFGGGTDLYAAVESWEVEVLKETKRQYAIVFTDGDIGNPDRIQEKIKELSQKKREAFVISVAHMPVKNERFIPATSMNEIPGAIGNIVNKILRKQ